MPRWLSSLLIAFGVIGLVTGAGLAWCRAQMPEQAASLLDIPALPPSVSDVRCVSEGITDVFVRCSFAIAPEDLPKLMTGHPFSETKRCPPGPIVDPCMREADLRGRRSHGSVPKVGPDFAIARRYDAEPPEFKHGGSVILETDQERRRVLLTYYRE